MNLPIDFTNRMKELLKDEFDYFFKSYNDKKTQGIRINTLKVTIEDFLKINPFTLEKICWAEDGFYYSEKDRPGKHPYHDAGLYYIQEPSAMAVAEILDPKQDEKILDLCAAPGGKTTHIASKMKQTGFILSNEINPTRAKILSQNVERMGIKNTVVTNETPERLSEKFKCYFDKILVDAPCSGEGMFRKDPNVIKEWSLENVNKCRERQLNILKHAKKMLKPEGIIVYSTCTFSYEENESVIYEFIKENPNFKLLDINFYSGFSRGVNKNEGLDKTIRIWPHKVKGEGHFIAVLKKTDGYEINKNSLIKFISNKKGLKNYYEFVNEFLLNEPEGNYITFGEQLYITPSKMLNLDNLKVIRPGFHLGTIKKNRFEPSHSMAICLTNKDVINSINFDSKSSEIYSYLKGETIVISGNRGWNLVTVDGYSIGWGKLSNNTLKNHYPKGLRWK